MTVSHDARTDAELVRGYLAGDRNALGAMYDRFAPGLYDTARAMLSDRDEAADVVQDVFCVAATKLGQLREADRVKPWLYAIARHEVFRRTKRRGRVVLGLDAEESGAGAHLAAPADPRAEAAGVETAELATLVREAARGLDASDQLLLELSTRQGLAGADLAAAMGVTLAQSHSMLFRMRERVERAIGAYVVVRGGRRECAELAAVLAGWDGTFDVLWRKRIARHVDQCEQCTVRRRRAVAFAGMAPAFAAPAWLRDATLRRAAVGPGVEPQGYEFSGDDGFPVARSTRVALGTRLAAITTAATIVGMAILLPLLASGDDDISASVASGPVAVAAAAVDPVTTESNAATSTTTSATTSTTSTTTTTTSTTTTLAPPTTTPVFVAPTTTFTGAPPRPTTTTTVGPEPTRPTSVTTVPAPSTSAPAFVGPIAVVAATEATTSPNQPPSLARLSVSPSSWTTCNGPGRTTASVIATDDAGVTSVVASWSGQRQSGSTTLTGSGGSYSGVLGPVQPVAGSYDVTVTATDTAGANASASTKFVITAC